MKKTEVKNNSKYTEDWLPIKNIENGYIKVKGNITDGDQIVTGVRIEAKNIFMSDSLTQQRTVYGLTNLYNTLDYEFWLVCCDRPVDISIFRTELELQYNEAKDQQIRKLIIEDLNKCDRFIGPEISAVDTEFYILFKDSEKNMDKIQKRLHNLISGLATSGLNSRQLTEEDARVLLDSFFNDSKRIEYGTVMADV